MFRIIHSFLLCFLVIFLYCNQASAAWPWENTNTLVTINREVYTLEDYKRWWNLWNEKKNAVPENPQKFIEWKLIAQEALTMELDQTGGYKRKLEVFLKSRTRMQLKYEEVDARMQPISEQDIRERYDIDYSPISLGISLYFDTMEKAANASKNISEGKISVNDLLHSPESEGGPIRSQNNIIRPLNYKADNNPIVKAVQLLDVGKVSEPFSLDNLFVIFVLLKRIDHDPEDFNKKKKNIQNKLRKERQAELTNELMINLKEKYAVKVDQELLTRTTVDLTGEILNQPIVTTSKGDIPLKLLVKDLRKEEKIAPTADQKALDLRKLGLLNGMIMEYLITWESLGRHYEEKTPFKWTYEFYKENRLINAFDSHVIRKQMSITSDDIEAYYSQHIEKYTGSPAASIALLEEKEDVIRKIWQEINVGQDFFVVAKRYFATVIPVKEVVLDELSPELLGAVKNLTVGEVSPPFKSGKGFGLIKLIDLHPAEPIPLAKVKKVVKRELYNEKFIELRKAHLEKLIGQSTIELNQRAWNRLKKEFTNNSNAN